MFAKRINCPPALIEFYTISKRSYILSKCEYIVKFA